MVKELYIVEVSGLLTEFVCTHYSVCFELFFMSEWKFPVYQKKMIFIGKQLMCKDVQSSEKALAMKTTGFTMYTVLTVSASQVYFKISVKISNQV